ncbi:hypothetical protein, partial [Streptomyces sp. NPDC031705]|uniref:hypothetical protein n=1 Tax=Streptomyces sp. NPDC031705 TaxID=3155729 RepID=UPI00340E23A1
RTTDLSAKDAQTAIEHLRTQVDEHHAVGDLDSGVTPPRPRSGRPNRPTRKGIRPAPPPDERQ